MTTTAPVATEILTVTDEPRTIGSNAYRATGLAGQLGDRPVVVFGEKVATICGRCGGKGGIAHYGHVFDGECFACRWTGRGHLFPTREAAVKAERARQRAAVRAQAKAAAQAAEFAAKAEERKAAELAKLIALGDSLYDEAKAEDALHVPSRYVGEVGTKVTFTGEVVTAATFESGFGYRTFNKRIVAVKATGEHTGATFVTFTTAEFAWDLEKGDRVTLTGAVKQHEEYRGTKQTVIVRPKLVERVAHAAA